MNPLLPIAKEQLNNPQQWLALSPLTSNHDMLIVLQLWVTARWLRPVDQALASFLHDQTPTTSPLALLAAALTSYQLNHGHVCLDIELALQQPELTLSLTYQYSQETWSANTLLRQIKSQDIYAALEQCAFVSTPLQHTHTPLILNQNKLYLYRYWHYETILADHIRQRLAIHFPMDKQLPTQLSQLFNDNHDKPDWQKIACAVATRAAFSIITGGPGTGKTTTVIKLLVLLQTPAVERGHPLNIQLAAPTGKAAARLTESIGKQVADLNLKQPLSTYIPTQVSTLHRLLGSRPNTRHFKHNKTHPLAVDILIVDEASMIDLELFAHLLEALPNQARLILLGDKDQLASVEAGAVLGNLCEQAEKGLYSPQTVEWIQTVTGEHLDKASLTMGDDQHHKLAQQTVMLKNSRRFSHHSGIGQLAKQINLGKFKKARQLFNKKLPDLNLLTVDKLQTLTFNTFILEGSHAKDGYSYYLNLLKEQRPPSSTPLNDIRWQEWAQTVHTAFNQFQLLCVLKEGAWGTKALNKHIAYTLYKQGYLSAYDHWYEGRPVLVTHNDYTLGLMNGDIGITLAFPQENDPNKMNLRVAFPYNDGSGKLHFVLPSRLSNVESVFAMTVHKSQGSEFNHTTLIIPDQPNPILSRELLYTAITRAKQHFTLVEKKPSIFDNSVQRKTVRLSGLEI